MLILTYTVSATDDDGSPLSDTETVTITITGTGDAPVITGGPDLSSLTETNAGLTDSGTFTVTDLDLTDNVTATVDSVVVTGTGAGSVPGSLTTPPCEASCRHSDRDPQRHANDQYTHLEFQFRKRSL